MGLLRRKSILLVILLAVSLILLGCGPATEKAGGKAPEEPIGKETGKNVETDLEGEPTKTTTGGDSLKASSTYSWPSEMPSDVPVFFYAEISETIEANEEAGKSFTLTLTEVENDALETYKSDLKSSGWNIEFTQQFEEGWSMIAVKDVRGIQVLDNGDGTGMLVYLPDISKF